MTDSERLKEELAYEEMTLVMKRRKYKMPIRVLRGK